MHPLRWMIRALLLVAVVALAAGCAAPQESEGGDDTQAPPVDVTPPGCIEEGQTGSGTGDITADDVCPGADDGSVNGTTAG